VHVLVKAAAPARKRVPAWLDGRHHQRRRGGAERRAFRLGSMAVASTSGEKRVSSPLWPLAEVERGGEVRRRGLPARKKTRAAARRRGGRGSSGSRHSWRVRLLPRAAPVFAAYGSPAGGSSPPFLLLLHPFSSGGRCGRSGAVPLVRLGFGAPSRARRRL
jgi:hypothetical protein